MVDSMNVVSRMLSVHVTPAEWRNSIATTASVHYRMHCAVDLLTYADGVTIGSGDDHAMEAAVDDISSQHVTDVAFGRAQAL